MDELSVDRYDDSRRAWIARHAGLFTVQKRRAEVLNRQIRDRTRRSAGARPDPHDDNVINPLIARRPTTVDGYLECALVSVIVVVAPLGWLLGVLLYRWVLSYIPGRLLSYPIPAMLWTSVALGVLTGALYERPDDLGAALLAPWLVAQVPATFLAAGLYGLLNGWLAVDGSTRWWPVTPAPPTVELDLPWGPDDMTAPSVFAAPRDEASEPIRRRRHSVASQQPSLTPVLTALVAAAVGIAWTASVVVLGAIDAARAVFPWP